MAENDTRLDSAPIADRLRLGGPNALEVCDKAADLIERMLFALQAARGDFQGYEQERSGEDYNNPALNAIIEAAQAAA